uniref:ATP synthase complex subunit 8 n=1 Tax=Heterocentrotus mammillatus TaxID=31180 RepID=A0A1W5HYV4_HETMA|nr:ATP synthase F0 subunit 8 [Heterocentrotus mammillatus]AID60564.1 ATP synthase F0 subunit 8 [Heterocentrotus mammillatus]
MPQLDFTWWIINFFIVWASVLVVLTILLNSIPSNNTSQTSSVEIKKESTSWQWL